jgi:methylmalonyl-CoA mutase C-terminal domain/subunit
MEVIYTGLRQTPEQIVSAAVQEDVDAIGISILSGAHMTLFPRILELMAAQGIADKLVFGGGIIPEEDVSRLKAMGIKEIFLPGSSTQQIVDFLNKNMIHAGS